MNKETFSNLKLLLCSGILILTLAILTGCAKKEQPTGTEAEQPTAEAEAEQPTAEAEVEQPTAEAAEHPAEEHPTEEHPAEEAEHPTEEGEHPAEEAEHPTEEGEHPAEEAEHPTEEHPAEEGEHADEEAEHPDEEESSKDEESEQTQEQPQLEVGLADISNGIKKHIAELSAQSTDGMFHADYDGVDLALTLVKVHDEKLAILGSGAYFACTDLKDTDGSIFDLDFFLTGDAGNMKVTETTVHKDNGKPLYGWKQRDDGVWIKSPLE